MWGIDMAYVVMMEEWLRGFEFDDNDNIIPWSQYRKCALSCCDTLEGAWGLASRLNQTMPSSSRYTIAILGG
jgi:hypothetical protein